MIGFHNGSKNKNTGPFQRLDDITSMTTVRFTVMHLNEARRNVPQEAKTSGGNWLFSDSLHLTMGLINPLEQVNMEHKISQQTTYIKTSDGGRTIQLADFVYQVVIYLSRQPQAIRKFQIKKRKKLQKKHDLWITVY